MYKCMFGKSRVWKKFSKITIACENIFNLYYVESEIKHAFGSNGRFCKKIPFLQTTFFLSNSKYYLHTQKMKCKQTAANNNPPKLNWLDGYGQLKCTPRNNLFKHLCIFCFATSVGSNPVHGPIRSSRFLEGLQFSFG